MSASVEHPGASKRGNTNNLKPYWVKGQSGNPKGRPKAPEDIAALCRVHTVECINVLVETMRLKSHKDRIQAAQTLLDRGWGKPRQSVELSADSDAIGLHLTAARALVAALDDAAAAVNAAPPTIDGLAEREPATNALDAPKPIE
jgi:hypothetical protein